MPKAQATKRKTSGTPNTDTLKPLNFKVPADFHREFKTHAAARGISMLDLLREGFELSKRQQYK